MMRKGALVFGLAFALVGVLGFVPPLTPEGYLFGLFQVDGLHNTVHLVSGVLGLAAWLAGEAVSRLYIQAFGVVYGLLTVFGFFHLDAPLFGIMAHNPGDVGLHLTAALIAIYLGFVAPRTPVEPAPPR